MGARGLFVSVCVVWGVSSDLCMQGIHFSPADLHGLPDADNVA